MPGKPHKWPPLAEVRQIIGECKTWAEAGERFDLPRTTVQSFCDRHGIEPPGVRNISPSATSIDSIDDAEWGDIERLLQSRGLNLDGKPEWIVRRCRVNEWGDGNRQLRVDLEPASMFPMPARSDGWRPPKLKGSRHVSNGLTALMGDFHAPHHCQDLLVAAVQWVKDHAPERIVILGDLMDYGSISRHSKTGLEPGLDREINEAYSILRAFKQASPATNITLLDGNHEQRMKTALEGRGLVGLSHLTRADDDVPVLSTRHLLRLDELEVETVDPPAPGLPYEYCEARVCDGLVARHGHVAKKGSGASALEIVNRLHRSIVVGHTHRQSIVYATQWPDGVQRTLVGCEAGTMAEIEHGLGYAVSADWQQGFAVCQQSRDGFTLDLATFIEGRLRWRNWESK